MIDTTSDQLRTLIERNRELEIRLQALQHTIAILRADFEEMMAGRMKELEQLTRPEADLEVGDESCEPCLSIYTD
jgi:hypothetical protein